MVYQNINLIWCRTCNECQKEIPYSEKDCAVGAERRQTLCRSCVQHTRQDAARWFKGMRNYFKGRTFNEEHKRKLSEAKKGNIRTPEHCANISKALKGKVPWNIGISSSTETRNKISKAALARDPKTRLRSEATKLKMSNSRHAFNKTLTPAQRSEMAEIASKQKWARHTFEFPDGRVETLQGYEPITMRYLLSASIAPCDIHTKTPGRPTIPYEWSGSRTYLPDCFLSDSQTIVETKSNYTWLQELDKNNAKLSASIALYDTRLIIWDKRERLVSDQTFPKGSV